MRGDVAELETILDATATNEERAAARAAIDLLNSRVGDIISKSVGEASIANFPGNIATKPFRNSCRTRMREMPQRKKPGSLLTTVGFRNELFHFPHVHGWIVFAESR